MAISTKASVMAVVEETTAGTLEDYTAADFIELREGFSLTSENEVEESDALSGSIGKSKDTVLGQNPSGSVPLYNKHSQTEGQEPEFGIMIESCLGSVTVNGTEYDTVAGSGTTSVIVDTDEGANFSVGQGLLIKDATNDYSIRNVSSVSTDTLNLNFNISDAPAAGVNLGKAVNYRVADSDHPKFSAYLFQSESNSKFKQAIAECQTESLTFDFPTRESAQLTAEFQGVETYFNFLEVTDSSKYIDYNEGGGSSAVTLSTGFYQYPQDLASEVQTKLDASATATITCTYSSTTGKFTITSDGATFELEWSGGTNAANNAASLLGFSSSADDTGAVSYVSDTAQDYDPSVTPTYDGGSNIIVKNSEIFIGDSDDNVCRKAENTSITIGGTVTDVKSICASNGIDEKLVTARDVSITATIPLAQHESELFHRSVNNTETSIMINVGPKTSSGNWEAGKCFNIYLPKVSLTKADTEQGDGYYILSLEGTAFRTSSFDDVYINYL